MPSLLNGAEYKKFFRDFIGAFLFLFIFGPSLDAAFSSWSTLPTPFSTFGTIMRFLAPSPEEKLLAFLEAVLFAFYRRL